MSIYTNYKYREIYILCVCACQEYIMPHLRSICNHSRKFNWCTLQAELPTICPIHTSDYIRVVGSGWWRAICLCMCF